MLLSSQTLHPDKAYGLYTLCASTCAAGLFRGFGVTLLRDTPSYGIYFPVYAMSCSGLDSLRQRMLLSASAAADGTSQGVDSSSLVSSSSSGGGTGCSTSMTVQFLAGGVAGMVAWLSVYPLDIGESPQLANKRTV